MSDQSQQRLKSRFEMGGFELQTSALMRGGGRRFGTNLQRSLKGLLLKDVAVAARQVDRDQMY